MEIETILALVGAIIGGGGIVGFVVGLLTIKYERHKAKGEAHSAEYEGRHTVRHTGDTGHGCGQSFSLDGTDRSPVEYPFPERYIFDAACSGTAQI